MEHVVVTAQPVDDGLLRRGLVTDDPVGLLVLWNWLCLRGSCDALGEVAPRGTCAKVEGGGLRFIS